jgi:hypothetical protein
LAGPLRQDPPSTAFSQKLALARTLTHDLNDFIGAAGRLTLRGYQKQVAETIIDSVLNQRGHTIVVQFPRQSGKNELQAQVEAYLLTMFRYFDAEMVKVSPTWKPQTLNAMRRLQRALERNLLARGHWQKEAGYIYRLGRARIFFLSGSPTTSVVGATASTLLQCDEAQDILAAKWDKDFSPMAASTNATRVFWGTAWTSQTLLARERRAAEAAESRDGVRRVFVIDADRVAQEVPAYGEFVREQVARLGRSHPLIKTQFYGEEIDAEGGMFPAARLAMMLGTHVVLDAPLPGRIYAILIDVAGQDEAVREAVSLSTRAEGSALENPRRDSTALTVVEVDLSSLADPLIQAPAYRVVHRRLWTGANHTLLYGQIRSLIEQWRARWVVIDATGVGAGLASFVERAFPGVVLPFVFSQSSKSKLGWDFLGVIDSGRYKEYDPQMDRDCFSKDRLAEVEGTDCVPSLRSRQAAAHTAAQKNTRRLAMTDLQSLFFRQAQGCQYEVLPGLGKVLRWSVPDGYRDPYTGELLHDDLLMSAALVAVLDAQQWAITGPAWIVPRPDPLTEMDREGF